MWCGEQMPSGVWGDPIERLWHGCVRRIPWEPRGLKGVRTHARWKEGSNLDARSRARQSEHHTQTHCEYSLHVSHSTCRLTMYIWPSQEHANPIGTLHPFHIGMARAQVASIEASLSTQFALKRLACAPPSHRTYARVRAQLIGAES